MSQAGLITGFPLGGGNYANGQFVEMTSPDEISDVQAFSKLGPDVMKQRAGFAGYRLVSAGLFPGDGHSAGSRDG